MIWHITFWGLARVALLAQMLNRITNFQLYGNVQSKLFPATLAKPLLCDRPYFHRGSCFQLFKNPSLYIGIFGLFLNKSKILGFI